MVLVGHRRAEERHDPVAHHLIHRALVVMDGLHHPLQDRIEESPRLLGVPVGEELHRALEVGEQHGHVLAFAFESTLGGQDLLGEVLWSVGIGGAPNRGREAAEGCTGVPQLLQNLDPDGRSAPHEPQVRVKRPPHSRQKFDCGGLSCWHRGHFMSEPPDPAPPKLPHLKLFDASFVMSRNGGAPNKRPYSRLNWEGLS